MNMMVRYRRFETFHPASLLTELMRRQASGCLQVASGLVYWSIYLDQGRLTFATNSVSPFERLEQQLLQLSGEVPALGSPIWRRLRLLYSRKPFQPNGMVNPDYQAIVQMVQRRYLTVPQVNRMIENLAREVLLSLLAVRDGSYEVIDKSQFEDFPNLCQLDLRSLLNPTEAIPPAEPELALQAAPPPTDAISAERTCEAATPPIISAAAPIAESAYCIACIDDSPSILQVIRSFLDDRDLDILLINDPLKALLQIVRSKPDLILLDVGMPNLDGYELCTLLRRHPVFKTTPIVMVTGHTGFIDRAKAKIAGASGYLTKPFTKSELQDAVAKYLVKKPA